MAAEASGPGLICAPACITVSADEAAAMDNREFDYDQLVRPMESRMMRSIWRIVRDKEAAEDALQDALAVIWRKRDTVARHPNPQALILRISVDAAVDAARKIRRRLGHEAQGLPEDAPDGAALPVTKALEDRGLRAAVLEAISRLPKRQATAVLLHIVEEQPYEEVARAMDCSGSTARVHVLRGRAALARRLSRERPDLVDGREGIFKEAES